MTAPTFSYKSAQNTDPTDIRFGGADISHLFKILDASHPTQRLQISAIEGKELLTDFDWLLKGTAGSTIQVWNLKTGLMELNASEFRTAVLHIMNTLPVSAPAEAIPVTKIALNGTLDCVNRGAIFNRSCIVDGFGTANIRHVTNYSNDAGACVLINTSNVCIRNLTIEDTIMDTSTYGGNNVSSQGIICSPAAPGVENIFIENVRIKNIVNHCMSFSVPPDRYIKNINLRRCVVNSLSGSAITIRTGTTNANVEYCDVLDSGHTGIDLSGVYPPIKIQGCRIFKSAQASGTGGAGIAAVTYAERYNTKGLAEEIILRDNFISGPGITQDGIIIHGEAANVVIENNVIDGCGRYGIQVKSFTFDTGEYNPEAGDPKDVYSREVFIYDNIIRNTFSAGANITGEPNYPFHAISIVGNYFDRIQGSAAIILNSDVTHSLIAHNQIYRPNSRALVDGSGIKLSINCPDTSIYGNTIFTDANATHSIWESGGGSSANRTFIVNNQIVGSTVKPITTTGPNTIIHQNIGYKTESSGTASISDPNSSITVNHGLSYTPTARQIRLIPTNDLSNANRYWHAGYTNTQFTINIDVAPGSGNPAATFVWAVTRRID